MPREIKQHRYLTTKHGKEIHKILARVIDPNDSTKVVHEYTYLTDGRKFGTFIDAVRYLEERYGNEQRKKHN